MNTNQEFQREGLSVFEACAVAGIGRTKLYEAIATGELVARKFGKRRIILRDDLRQFLMALPVEAQIARKSQTTDSGE
jgi:excisionase family DNA binding protein